MIMKIVASLLAIGLVSAHMELEWPYPLRSKYDPNTPTSLIDYSMTDPLKTDGMLLSSPFRGINTWKPEDQSRC
jgi:hypothetical protein